LSASPHLVKHAVAIFGSAHATRRFGRAAPAHEGLTVAHTGGVTREEI
jgi:hypothetical protein